MKKYIGAFIIALTTITMVSCDKKQDVDAISATLPGIQISSVGMFTAGPYALPPAPSTSTPAPVSVIQVIYGATTTNKSPGSIDVTLYDASVLGPAPAKLPNLTPLQTFHFNSWSGNDSANSPSYGSVSFATVPTSYPNTSVYQGSILIKIPSVSPTYPAGSPLLSGKLYNIKVVLTSSDGATSSYTQNSIFAIQ